MNVASITTGSTGSRYQTHGTASAVATVSDLDVDISSRACVGRISRPNEDTT
jgi:hypothetical protein